MSAQGSQASRLLARLSKCNPKSAPVSFTKDNPFKAPLRMCTANPSSHIHVAASCASSFQPVHSLSSETEGSVPQSPHSVCKPQSPPAVCKPLEKDLPNLSCYGKGSTTQSLHAPDQASATAPAVSTVPHPALAATQPSHASLDPPPSPASPHSHPVPVPNPSSLAVVRPLYKSLLLATRELDGELGRFKTNKLFSITEESWMKDNIPDAVKALAWGGATCMQELVRTKFREPLPGASLDLALWDAVREKQELGKRLDRGFAALALLSNRLRVLRIHAGERHSDCVTRGVRVSVASQPSRYSDRMAGFLFNYRVQVRNESEEEAVQLVSRHWVITDFDGIEQHVVGPGVIGYQPIIEQGEMFEYPSFVPVRTKRGTMRGTFAMLGVRSNELFDVDIAPFGLVP